MRKLPAQPYSVDAIYVAKIDRKGTMEGTEETSIDMNEEYLLE